MCTSWLTFGGQRPILEISSLLPPWDPGVELRASVLAASAFAL